MGPGSPPDREHDHDHDDAWLSRARRAGVCAALGFGLAHGGCAAGRGVPPALVAAPGQSQEHLDAGRMLFSGHCQGCHALPAPSDLTATAWPAKVEGMARKSGLSDYQTALVADYLVAASRRVQ
jgi:mono/diheme cytochrome c family protein